jgi:hypothetical protein
VVVVRQRLGKCRQMIARHPNPAQTPYRAVLQQHRLGEDSVDVQSYDPHELASSVLITEAGGRHGNYGSVLTAHPGEPQGRLDNGSGSQPIVQASACPHSRAPGAPCPGSAHHSADPKISGTRGTEGYHAG